MAEMYIAQAIGHLFRISNILWIVICNEVI